MRVAAVLSLCLMPLLGGCGSSDSTPASGTQLTIRAINTSVGRSEFHLECGPVGGDLPDPARACAALAERPELVTSPKPFVCAGGRVSWWDITISGRLDGEAIERDFSTCWTSQMATLGQFGMTWEVLQDHLLLRQEVEMLPETTRTFLPGVLQPADVVACDIRGHHLELGVPAEAGPSASNGYSGAHIVPVLLTVKRNSDGSVDASCKTDF